MNAEHRKQARVPGFLGGRVAEAGNQVTQKDELNFKRSDEFENRVAQFRFGSGEVKSTCVELVDTDGNDLVFVEFNQDVVVKVYFEAYAEKELSVNISIFDDKKNNIIGCGFPHIDQPYLVTKEGARYLAEYSLKLPLQEGNYSLRVNISSTIVENETAEFIDVVSDAIV
ncbi:Wzt carbohydrate-binding domain-containing protein, partial [Streptomyces sp. IBSBF 2953]|nr:Wzt carbohydrate-binding domain-containing protein [Streptomyces hayashii]